MKSLRTFIATQRNMSSEEYRSLVGMGDELSHEMYSVYGNEEVGFYHIGHISGGYHLNCEGTSVTANNIDTLERTLWDGFAKWEITLTDDEIIKDLNARVGEVIDRISWKGDMVPKRPIMLIDVIDPKQADLLDMSHEDFLLAKHLYEALKELDKKLSHEKVGYAIIKQLIGGVATFFEFSDDDNQYPILYPTMKEARHALADHIIDLANEFKDSDMEYIDNNLFILPAGKLGDTYEAFNDEGDIVFRHTPKTTLPVESYDIEVCRTSYAHRTITVKATSLEEAQDLALEEAGNYEFSEGEAEYSAS